MSRIGGDHTQAISGKLVSYAVEYAFSEGKSTGNWWGEVVLLGGKRHKLVGGRLTNLTKRTMPQAVISALTAEIDLLDLDKLDTPHGN